jgi:hypothetical protein
MNIKHVVICEMCGEKAERISHGCTLLLPINWGTIEIRQQSKCDNLIRNELSGYHLSEDY